MSQLFDHFVIQFILNSFLFICFSAGHGYRSCGHIDIPGVKVSILELLQLSLKEFSQLSNSLGNASITLDEDAKGKCFIEICGYPTFMPSWKSGLDPRCIKFNNSSDPLPKDPFEYGFEATAIFCGCKENDTSHCEDKKCSDPDANAKEPICASLYAEENCQSCYNSAAVLYDRETNAWAYETGTGPIMRWAEIGQNCTLNVTGYTFSPNYSDHSPSQEFIPIWYLYKKTGKLEPTYSPRGESFICTCAHKPSLIPKNTTNATITWTLIGGVVFLTLGGFLASAVFIRKRRRRRQSSLPLLFHQAFNYNQDFTLDKSKVLGKGQYGVVYLGQLTNTGSTCAIKTVERLELSHDNQAGIDMSISAKSIFNEVKALVCIGSHPNIVSIIGSDCTKLQTDEIYLILEFCENGCLKDYLKSIKVPIPQLQASNDPILAQYFEPEPIPNSQELCSKTLKQMYLWSKNIAEGMICLQEKNILHMDLSARNILVDGNLVAKLADFGLARKVDSGMEYVKQTREPLPVAGGNALEVLISLRDTPTNPKFTTKSEVWSYGTTLWEIFSFGETPYEDIIKTCISIMDVRNKLISFLEQEQRLACPPVFANKEATYETMKECWDSCPSKRPDFNALKAYFSQLIASTPD